MKERILDYPIQFTPAPIQAAPIPYRFLAALLDVAILVFLLNLPALLRDLLAINISLPTHSVHMGVYLLSIAFLYYPIQEAIWGQTPGKRIMRLKVIRDNGSSISFFQAVGRFYFGLFDMLFLMGIFFAITSKQNKRLGDQLAHTVVVRHKRQAKTTGSR